MWELIHNEQAHVSVALQLLEMRQKLASFGEMERILKERNASREACRYLLEARKLLAHEGPFESQTLDIARPGAGRSNQLAA
jgi:hypothetical protein